ncbi:MAG TPA: hypothetical protein VH083_22280 [Myxococcales bacterium]|jgi:hypothetical protein|nr:hypothetical protein [Myxococcales bacterium]
MKRTAISALICAIVFGILATWLGPKMIAYYYAPPVTNSLSSACNDSIAWAMNKLVLTQLVGTGLGLVVGLVAGILLRSKKQPVAGQQPVAGGSIKGS